MAEPINPAQKALDRIAVALETIALEVLADIGLAPGLEVRAEIGHTPELTVLPGIPPAPTIVRFPPIGWKCPEHNSSRMVEAGTTRAGRPYAAFVACGDRDCRRTADRDQRAAAAQQAGPRALP